MPPNAKISRPSQSTRPPRLLIYARSKKGKSALSASAGQGRVLIIDPEHGTDWMNTPKLDPHVWHVSKWEDVIEAVRFATEARHDYDWIAPDGLTRITKMALKWVIKQSTDGAIDRRPGMVMLKDRGRAGELVENLLYRLHSARDVGVIFTAQERIVADTGSGDDVDEESLEEVKLRYVPDLPNQVRASVTTVVDVIGRLYVVKNPDDETKLERRLWISPHPQYDTGFRSCFQLPDFIRRPSVPRIVSALESGRYK
jgi:hypothetical protein